jgi:gamma-glutamylcyclotransferase (GGCT)/AIG2-like uncharacterized protein YtfP
MVEFLFLYGTLLPELAPAPLRASLAKLRRLGPGWVPGRLYDLGRYPGAVLDPATATRVVGQVFELPDEPAVLAALDAYEGFVAAEPAGSLYVREQRPVTLADGRRLACWMYVYNRDPGDRPLVPDGDYRRWRAAGPG